MSLPTRTPQTHFTPCPELIRLQEKLNNLNDDTLTNTKDLRPLIELAAQIKLLMSLSIGGGALSLINLIIVLAKGN